MTNDVLGIIDPERGFMPGAEGRRLGIPGFGELPVPHGERIVPNVNRLLGMFATYGLPTFITKDYHPWQTAHFSNTPDYKTTWPVHCVAGTKGSKLHPDIVVPSVTRNFIKGTEPLEHGEDDTSYSAYYAHGTIPILRKSMPDWLREQNASHVYLGGLALDYCVGKTALDFKQKLGLEVTVVLDATAGITKKTSQDMLQQFAKAGIHTTTTDVVVQKIRHDRDGFRKAYRYEN